MYIGKSISVGETKALGVVSRVQFSRCDKNYRGRGLYVLDFYYGVKVGIGKNLCNRLKEYEHPWTRDIVNAAYYRHPNPAGLERLLKRRFVGGVAAGSTEFFHGQSFETVVRFIENNEFFREDK